MSGLRKIYRVIRSVVFSVLLSVAGLMLLVYILVAIPPIQDAIRKEAERQLSVFFATDVRIGQLNFTPFNRIELRDVAIPSPDGRKCITATRVGAGIELWHLITQREFVITYAELIGLDFYLSKKSLDGELNIQFLIDALKPKEAGKPPTKFDLKIHSVVIRKSSFSFDKEWVPYAHRGKLDFNHISLKNIRADVDIPQLKNDNFVFDIRALSAEEKSGLVLDNLKAMIEFSDRRLSVKNLLIALPGTLLCPNDFSVEYNGYANILPSLKNNIHTFELKDNKVTISDFSSILPQLSVFTEPIFLTVDVTGDISQLNVGKFLVKTSDGRLNIDFSGSVSNFLEKSELNAELSKLELNVSADELEKIMTRLIPTREETRNMILRLGQIRLKANGIASSEALDAKFNLESSIGKIEAEGKLAYKSKDHLSGEVSLSTPGFNLGALMPNKPFGELSLNAKGNFSIVDKEPNGHIEAMVDFAEYNGYILRNVSVDATKRGEYAQGKLAIEDVNLNLDAEGSILLNGEDSKLYADINLYHFVPDVFGVRGLLTGYTLGGEVSADLTGNNLNNLLGTIALSNFDMQSVNKPSLRLNRLEINSISEEPKGKKITIASDWFDGKIEGQYNLTDLPGGFIAMVGETIPVLKSELPPLSPRPQNFAFDFLIHNDNTLSKFFDLPIRLLTDVEIKGALADSIGKATLDVNIPYLQQGKDKLIRSTRLIAGLNSQTGESNLLFATMMPGKKGDISLNLSLNGLYNDINTDFGWKMHRDGVYDGKVSLSTEIQPSFDGRFMSGVEVKVNPSIINVAGVPWQISPSSLDWREGKLSVDNVRISNRDQFVMINGVASKLPTDTVSVEFSSFDLDYLFETLNINYVTFGGSATGKAIATSVFSSNPIARTERLRVDSLTYNGALLGDRADIKGTWDNLKKRVGIYADIYEKGNRCANVDGGVWVVGDSLSFDFDANKVNVQFLKPFMAAFTSDVEGRASGQAKLYGTFHDIDMTGRLYADTIRMKVDYTNTWYGGSDSVYIYPGRIEIPSFRLYDRYGNSGILTGNVGHKFFHEPTFDFRLSEAKGLLAFDTNAEINPDWYGTVYVNGGAIVKGVPGIVNISVDVTTASNTQFTYVLSDREAAEEYTFLTFSDRRKDLIIDEQPDTVPEFVKNFRKKVEEENSIPSIFTIDLRVDVTPGADLYIIMDPRAGDKISVRGVGAMQMDYDSRTDELRMYGKYTIDEGNYLFTLQDLIIRDFRINPGSSISFNGDPLNAMVDIEATYRVNTNLSDLDKSFATDRELNRTNVPVDAVLILGGGLTDPEISYDIKLPTLTSDVERKVKSIISTEDMMSRQILYLLALNKFYTPDYMSQSSNGGGELASVASSTISSQLSNILGQISDKWSISPSFRSDKGDFSDTEVDVALSSRLLNNRLLINGNLGYRDRSTSQTTFVGDFDIEYLLNRKGNLRLKAYNHFNDQNYYLRSSLTTQGLGLIYRKDFDNPFSFLRRRRKIQLDSLNTDSVKKE